MTEGCRSCRIVVLISGGGTNLQALIDAQLAGELEGQIVAVISNRPGVRGLERAVAANIEAIELDHHQFETREAFDEALGGKVDDYEADLVVLAGFMRILTPGFVRRFSGKMINIHPSLLPKYRGLHTHQRVLESGDAYHGASVHFVTEKLDSGCVIIQARFPVSAEHTAESLAADLLNLEHQIYPLAVKWFCLGRLVFSEDLAWFDGKLLDSPIQLHELESAGYG